MSEKDRHPEEATAQAWGTDWKAAYDSWFDGIEEGADLFNKPVARGFRAGYTAAIARTAGHKDLSSDLRASLLLEALKKIANESVFNQLRYAEDSDTDYFLRCFKAVKECARTAIQRVEGRS